MAKTPLGAIVEAFGKEPIAGFVNGGSGLWVGVVPPEYALPFVALEHTGNTIEGTTESDYYESCRVQFRVYEEGLEETEALASQITDAFDLPETDHANAAIFVDDAKIHSCVRGNYKVKREEMQSDEGAEVFSVAIDYTLQVVRKRKRRNP